MDLTIAGKRDAVDGKLLSAYRMGFPIRRIIGPLPT